MRCNACRVVSCLTVVLSVWGCGGKQGDPGATAVPPPPPPPPNLSAPKPAQPATPRPAHGQPPGGVAGKSGTQKSGTASSGAGSTSSTTVPTSNDFLMPEEGPRFEIAAASASQSQRQFYVVAPVESLPPHTVEVIPPENTEHQAPRGTSSGSGAGGASGTESNRRWTLPADFTVVASAGTDPAGMPLRVRSERDGSVLALVPGGVFLQGTDSGPREARPAHSMFVSPFYIGLTEITVAQYNRFREEAKSAPRGIATPEPAVNANAAADLPAVGISWRDASNYARFYGLDLPTEAEWEKAGRGSEGWTYPWGNGRPLWGRPRRPGELFPVRSFASDVSPYGVYDLSGNAREWVHDFYSPNAYAEAVSSDGTPPRDWTGPKKSEPANVRVLKGGSHGWELWHRTGAGWRDSPQDAGFRCVLRVTSEMSR